MKKFTNFIRETVTLFNSQPKTWQKKLTKSVSAVVLAGGILANLPFNVLQAHAADQTFNDVSASNPYSQAIDALASQHIVTGFSDGSFKPNESLTRAQAAQMLASSLNLDTKSVQDPGFSDVASGKWYYKAIAALNAQGVVVGYSDGSFKPDQQISRAELAKLIALGYNLNQGISASNQFNDVKKGAWYDGYVSALFDNNITKGVSTHAFDPGADASREQAAAFFFRSNTEEVNKADEAKNAQPVATNASLGDGNSVNIDGTTMTAQVVKGIDSISFDSSLAGTVVFKYNGKAIGTQQNVVVGTNTFSTTDILGSAYAGVVGNLDKLKQDKAYVSNGQLTADLTSAAGKTTTYTINVNVDTTAPTASQASIGDSGSVDLSGTTFTANVSQGLKNIAFNASEAGTVQFDYNGKPVGTQQEVVAGPNTFNASDLLGTSYANVAKDITKLSTYQSAISNGQLTAILTDASGNATTYKINVNVDTTAPTASQASIGDSGSVDLNGTTFTANNVNQGINTIAFNASEASTIQFEYNGKAVGTKEAVVAGANTFSTADLLGAAYAKVAGNIYTFSTYRSYVSNGQITAVLTDPAGNATTYKINVNFDPYLGMV